MILMHMPIKKKVPYLGLLLSFSIILSYVEFLIPFSFSIPGIKLGLSNLPVLLCIYLFGAYEAIIIALFKAILSSLLFGNTTTMIYSISGAILSSLVMILFKKLKKIHIVTVSILGGVFHNIGQLIIASLMLSSNSIYYYLPFLCLSGILTGGLLGLIAHLVLPYVKRIIYIGDKL